jgi:hypothetical protein
MRLLLTLVVMFVFVQLISQEKKEEVAKMEPSAPVNLKVLQATSASEVRQIMRSFAGGLGVQCSYCHVEGNFASDENPKKQTARQMIKLVQKVNTEFPDGKLHVSCYTCHRGETQPRTAPAPEAPAASR